MTDRNPHSLQAQCETAACAVVHTPEKGAQEAASALSSSLSDSDVAESAAGLAACGGPGKAPSGRRATAGYGWIFYDGQCVICSGFAERFRTMLLRRRLLLAPLQRGWVQERLELAAEDVLDEMRVLTSEGRVLGGASALVYLTGRIWWTYPLYALSKLPGAMKPLHKLYRWIARHRRRCAAGSCAMSP